MTACCVQSVAHALWAVDLTLLLCHDCDLTTSAINSYLGSGLTNYLRNCTAHFSRCRMLGSRGGVFLIVAYPGGPGVQLSDSCA